MADLLVKTSPVIFILSNFVIPAAISQALAGELDLIPYTVYTKAISEMVASISTT